MAWCVQTRWYFHDDVIKWEDFPRYWSFVRGIHRSPVNSPHKGQWRGALMFSLICAWTNAWVNNSKTGDLRRHRAHHDVIVMPEAKKGRELPSEILMAYDLSMNADKTHVQLLYWLVYMWKNAERNKGFTRFINVSSLGNISSQRTLSIVQVAVPYTARVRNWSSLSLRLPNN